MSQSVRDQLLQLGLVNEKRAKQAEKARRNEKRATRQVEKRRKSGDKAAPEAPATTTAEATRARAEQALRSRAERDREADRKRRLKEEKAALKAQIRQIIERRKEPRSNAEMPYNFVVGKKIKRIYVTKPLLDGLSAGQLAVVRMGEQFEVVRRDTAERLQQLDASVVVSLHERQATSDEDEYADKPIPDDLMW